MNNYANITKKISFLNKKLIKKEEIIEILETTNALIKALNETNNRIKTTSIQSKQNVFSQLMEIRVDLIDQKTDFIDLIHLIKKVLKRIYNTLQNTKSTLINIPYHVSVETDPIIKILKSIIILIKTAQKKHHILIPEETKIKKIEQKIEHLDAISKKITLMTNTVDIKNIPQLTRYLEFLLAKLPIYKTTITMLITIVDEAALNFYQEDFE